MPAAPGLASSDQNRPSAKVDFPLGPADLSHGSSHSHPGRAAIRRAAQARLAGGPEQAKRVEGLLTYRRSQATLKGGGTHRNRQEGGLRVDELSGVPWFAARLYDRKHADPNGTQHGPESAEGHCVCLFPASSLLQHLRRMHDRFATTLASPQSWRCVPYHGARYSHRSAAF